MDLNPINKLSEAEEAFKQKQFPEAIELYASAFHLTKEAYNSVQADILYKTSMIQIELNDPDRAISAAKDSLEFSSHFFPAHFVLAKLFKKLGYTAEAIYHLRVALEIEPLNSDVRKMIRSILPIAEMKNRSRKAFVGALLRRWLTKKRGEDAKAVEQYLKNIKFVLLRICFSSSRMASSTRLFLQGAVLSEYQSNTARLRMRCWFVHCQNRNNIAASNTFELNVSHKSIVQLLSIVKPMFTTLYFTSESFLNVMVASYEFRHVIYAGEQKLMTEKHGRDAADLIKRVSKNLTRLPYFIELGGFAENDKKFPTLHTVVFASSSFNIDLKFLKAWYEHMWPVTHVIFGEPATDTTLSNFKKFKYALCETVTKLHLPLANTNGYLSSGLGLTKILEHLKMFKRLFPSLGKVIGTFKFDVKGRNLADVSESIEKCIKLVIQNLDNRIKPRWCKKLWILVEFECDKSVIEEMPVKSEPLFDTIENIRHSVPQVRGNIQLHGVSHVDRDPRPNICCFAMIEFETDYASFQIAIQSQ